MYSKSSIALGKKFENQTADGVSAPIFVAGTKSIEFSIVTDATADFDILCIGSLQETPPDPSLAVGADNDYQYILYQDEETSGSYNASTPYNPTSTAVSRLFRFNTEGIRWAFIEVNNYVAGTLVVCNVNISDNQ